MNYELNIGTKVAELKIRTTEKIVGIPEQGGKK